MLLSDLFHHRSKNRSQAPADPHDTSRWPDAWKTTFIKVYPRFATKKLLEPSDVTRSISHTIRERHSTRVYRRGMTEQQLSNILFYTLGETDPSALEGRGRRAYASAGARYPLEAYVLLFERVGAHDPGVYHYALEAHGLTRIRHDALSDQDIDRYFRYPETKRASCAVVLTAVFHRASIKYGERSYRHVLLEAGGVGEQAYLVAGAEGVGCVVMSGYQDDALERLLDIDGVTESVVSTIVFG